VRRWSNSGISGVCRRKEPTPRRETEFPRRSHSQSLRLGKRRKEKSASGVVGGLFDSVIDVIRSAMTATITIDAAGRLVLPKAMRERLHLSAGARLKAQIVADKIELTPELDAGVRIERTGKRLVIMGGPPFNAVAAIKADREARDEMIALRVREK
jgi:AbrB family looped-hinge helix DNA binding protein